MHEILAIFGAIGRWQGSTDERVVPYSISAVFDYGAFGAESFSKVRVTSFAAAPWRTRMCETPGAAAGRVSCEVAWISEDEVKGLASNKRT